VRAPDHDKITSLIDRLGLDRNVVLHGALSRPEVQRLIEVAHIGLLSSRSEGMPNSVMEFMHAGLPVVATAIAGVQDLLGPDNRECLFAVGDPEALKRAIVRLAGDEPLRRRIGAANQRRIATEFAPENILPQWLDVLRQPGLPGR
jgi:glycosyltransferase involved in cell wall biosynthesis